MFPEVKSGSVNSSIEEVGLPSVVVVVIVVIFLYLLMSVADLISVVSSLANFGRPTLKINIDSSLGNVDSPT